MVGLTRQEGRGDGWVRKGCQLAKESNYSYTPRLHVRKAVARAFSCFRAQQTGVCKKTHG